MIFIFFYGRIYIDNERGVIYMINTLKEVSLITLKTNENKDKVNQVQARAIKTDLSNAMVELSKSLPDTEIMYNQKGLPVITFSNGLILGFDFIVHKLDTELTHSKGASK